MLQQLFEVDPLAYPSCHGVMRIVAFTTQAWVIDQLSEPLDMVGSTSSARSSMIGSTIRLPAAAVAFLAASCAGAVTQGGAVSADALALERATQQRFVLQGQLEQLRRLDNLSAPLLRGARGLCQDAVTRRAGARWAVAGSFRGDDEAAARALGISDTVTVTGVASGSGAERGGLLVGDRLVGIDAEPLPIGADGVQALGRGVEKRRSEGASSLGLEVVRAGQVMRLDVPLDSACAYGVTTVQMSDLNAFADGETVYVTSSMMRFASDEELSTVVAHEIAHNAMGHIQKKKRNAGIAALFGAVIDIAAASQGVNTRGSMTNQFAALGAQTFSQDFEREADYVGMYVLALSGRRLDHAADLWRRMAQESPGSIKYASSHPTTSERFLRIQQAAQEIEAKRAAGVALAPELKKG